ncbi:MAG: discoidin domain-containing protein, partial [Phycisphaerae bacterium]|nr:discoidin domain-containing protein [Phycisphaerae bacterium]
MSVMRYGCVLLRVGLVLILLVQVVPAVQAVEARRVPGMPPEEPITTGSDAAGGCDGIKNGRWGFHTDIVEKPWWRVDLGQPYRLDRIVIWNRCDETAPRNSHLVLSLSDDGTQWRTAYTHDGTTFFGYTDGRPLVVATDGQVARFVRIQLPGKDYLHLDEVEVFGSAEPEKNLALKCPADQQSVSLWSATEPFEGDSAFNLIRDKLRKALPDEPAELVNEFCLLHEEITLDRSGSPKWQWRKAYLATQVLGPEVLIAAGDRHPGDVVLRRTRAMIANMRSRPVAPDLSAETEMLAALETDRAEISADDLPACWELFRRAVSLRRRVLLADPLLDFDAILLTKRVPGTFNHMSDQYYGWFSRPGGGIYILRDFKGDAPTVECLTGIFTEPGSFLRPCLSYDARKILFAWCRHYPALAGEPDKLNKDNVPADAFYHVFEMNIDGAGVRQLTFGKYDDFDARYLPDGRIVFLSTRRGQFIQCSPSTAQQTVATEDLSDSYVRCGGGPERPVAVYTLHTMDADGGNLCAISPFENFEWTPSIADDGTILHSRWDYVDRYNNAFMSLWAINPDGASPRLVYGNFTWSPHTTFEAR